MNEESTGFAIGKEEYETERSAFELCRWVNEKLALMRKEKDFYTIYFEKESREYANANVKSFVDEVVPVACLGLYFFKPGSNVYVKCFAGNEPFRDAEIKVEGFNNFSIIVEVTQIASKDSKLRRVALARYGFAYASGEIREENGEVVQKLECVDFCEQNDCLTNFAFDRMKKKLDKLRRAVKAPKESKDRIDKLRAQNTAILVHLNVPMYGSLPLENRAELIRRTQAYLHSEKPDVYGIYYCYADDFVVDGIQFDDLI